MRIWSLHPKYLDNKGLVALWREALLAKHVLNGLTKGYRTHSQLERFKNSAYPTDCIDQYLATVYYEALERGYDFNKEKINWDFKISKMTVTSGQLDYEKSHLTKKLEIRDKKKYLELVNISKCDSHPIFNVLNGGIEKWEVIKEIS